MRNRGLDFVRVIAIIGVVIIHNCGDGLGAALMSCDWFSSVFIRTVISPSVPLFFMCSGALLLDEEKEISLQQLYTKRLPHIIVPLFIWALIYKFYHLILSGTLNRTFILQSLSETLLFRHESHLYFLHILIIIYIWIPVVRTYIKNATKSELKYLLAVWFSFGIIYPTLKAFQPFSLLSGIPQQWALNMTYAAIGYSLLGYYIKNCQLSRQFLVSCLILGLSVVFGGTVIISMRRNALYTGFFEGMSLGVALISIAYFGLLTGCNNPGPFLMNEKLSKSSFCIYLVHIIVIYALRGIGITTFSPYIISIPLIAALDIIISYFVYLVLKQIPFVKDWLI